MARTDERRWHYRIRYPDRAVPHLVIGAAAGTPCRVVDISEGGLRFLLAPGAPAPAADGEFGATLRLHEGREVALRCTVLRVDGRTESIRQKVLTGAYDNLNVIDQVARRMLAKGDV